MASPVAITARTLVEPLVLYVDGWTNHTHKLNAKIGSEPVETGALITDHVVSEPDIIELDGIVGDWYGGRRPAEAFEQLQRIMEAKQPVRVITEWAVYDETLLETVTADPQGRGMRLRAKFREIRRSPPPIKLSPIPSAAQNRLAALGAVGGGIFAQLGTIPTDVLERVQAHNAQLNAQRLRVAAYEQQSQAVRDAFEQQRLAAQRVARLQQQAADGQLDGTTGLDRISTTTTDVQFTDANELRRLGYDIRYDTTTDVNGQTVSWIVYIDPDGNEVRRVRRDNTTQIGLVLDTHRTLVESNGQPIFSSSNPTFSETKAANGLGLKVWQIRAADWFARTLFKESQGQVQVSIVDARRTVRLMVAQGVSLTQANFRRWVPKVPARYASNIPDTVVRGRVNLPDDK